jgi:hypothetical protein
MAGSSPAAGSAAARVCALNVLAQLHAAVGSLSAITRLVKFQAFVAAHRISPASRRSPMAPPACSPTSSAQPARMPAPRPAPTRSPVEAIAEPGS